ncbi:MAG: Trk system potassium transporter TrkA, partial [Clostridia bacterium]|nr:Trk system potassium transporter TrkA [Clostridia bacterium]
MKIVIVGGGTVGSAITMQLSEEHHDITVVDTELSNITELSNVCDVYGVVGNGADVSVLNKADAGKSDLVIAVTSSDEINILCCAAARKLGAQNTVARVRNPEYSELMQLMQQDMNLSMTINPELAAAEALYRMLRYPSAAKVETFYRGKVELVEFPLPADSPICNKPLSMLRSALKCQFLVCGVLRDDKMYSPSGDFVLKAGDVIGVTAPDGELTRLFKAIGVFKQPIRDLLIVGGGRVTYYLESLLARSKIDSTVVEENRELCYALSEDFNCTVVHDDGTKQEVLLEAGIESADAFLSLLDRDELNAILSIYAKTCKVPKVISLIKELSYVNFYTEMGLESIISPKSITASNILLFV